jgi:hypothetical protein
MDWIWSSRCLALLCTSTQSSHLKWVSRGGINSSRHQASRWLTATAKHTVGWTDTCFSGPSVHPVPPLRHLDVAVLWHNWYDAIHQWCFGSSGAEGLLAKTLLLAPMRPSDRLMLPLTKASVHSVLLNLSWCIFVLIQIGRRIDRWCPHLDRQIIRCYCLLQLYSFQSPDATRIWIVGSSDGTSFVWPSTQCTKCTDALPRVPSVHLTVSFSFFFSAPLTCHYFNFTYLTCHHCSCALQEAIVIGLIVSQSLSTKKNQLVS